MFLTISLIISALVLVVDQVSKFLVVSNFSLGESISLIPGMLNLTYINNSGAAFGMFQGKTWVFLAISIIIIVICVTMLIKKTYKSKLMIFSILLILSGGIGNMIDRIFNKGNVVDFLEFDFIRFPVFNVADCAICVGAGLVVFYFIIDFFKEINNKHASISETDKKEIQ